MTRFEDLEDTQAEVKLKQTLWESQKEWAHDYDTWNTVSLLCMQCCANKYTCTCIVHAVSSCRHTLLH